MLKEVRFKKMEETKNRKERENRKKFGKKREKS